MDRMRIGLVVSLVASLSLASASRSEEPQARPWQSMDNRRWAELPGMSVPFRGKVEVGVLAVNASRHPLKAELEGFKLDVIDEDTMPNSPSHPSTPKPAEPAGEKPEGT